MRVTEPLRASQINAALDDGARGVMRTSAIVDVISTGAGAISVQHNLGHVPDDFVVSRVDNVDVYATAAQREGAWSAASCDLTASGAGKFRVWFVRSGAA